MKIKKAVQIFAGFFNFSISTGQCFIAFDL
jgi:hypothetical protein